MRARSIVSAMLPVALLLAACTSADQKAAAAASVAEGALADGNWPVARVYALRALAERDDVSDYWLLLARVNVGANDLPGAFDAYQNVLTLDRGNLEALTSLCQLALAGKGATVAEKYADQLALVSPASTLPTTIRAAAALERGDKATAARLLQQVLDKEPADLAALIVKSRVLAADERFAEAAALIETTMSAPGDKTSRLAQLKDFYRKAGDRAGYTRTLARLARINPGNAGQQLDYADLLYGDGDAAAGYAVTRAVLVAKPNDLASAAGVLNLWLKYGRAAVPGEALVRDAAATELEGKATYAQYAAETGRAELAVAALGGAPVGGAPDPANSDAKAAWAYATGLRGDRAGAIAQLNAVLAQDPSQPRALLARARLRGDDAGALQDARRVLADDAGNVAARLTVAAILSRQNEAALAEGVLRDGLNADGGDPRIAATLARLLVADGRRAEAATMLDEFKRADPIAPRAGAQPPRPD